MPGVSNTPSVLLDMGIWSDDGTIWLPKSLYLTRSEAKMWAVENNDAFYIDVRCRTRWLKAVPEAYYGDDGYEVCSPHDEGAFECWELT